MIILLRYLVILITLVSQPALSSEFSAWRCLQNKVIELANVMIPPDVYRTAEQIEHWKHYKNDDNFARQLLPEVFSKNGVNYNFDNMEANRLSIEKIPISKLVLPRYLAHTPETYEKILILMRKGDTLTIEGDKIKLGDFLGSGNTTHIYALHNNPEEAVRIPFVSNLTHLADGSTNARNYSLRVIGERFSKIFVRNHKVLSALAPKYKIAIAKLIKVGPYFRYVIVERIWGKENGSAFLNQILEKLLNTEGLPQMFSSLSSEEQTKYIALREFVENCSEMFSEAFNETVRVTLPPPGNKPGLQNLRRILTEGFKPSHKLPEGDVSYRNDLLGVIRQTIWDEKRKLWVLLEGE